MTPIMTTFIQKYVHTGKNDKYTKGNSEEQNSKHWFQFYLKLIFNCLTIIFLKGQLSSHNDTQRGVLKG